MQSLLSALLKSRAIVLLTFVVFVAAWEIAVRITGVQAFVVPAPEKVLVAMYELFNDGTLLRNLWVTLEETLSGFAIASFCGVALGALISEFGWIRRAIYPYVVALQTVPKIAIAPILVVWFGFGLTSKVVIAATVAIFPILVNTIEGLAGTDENRIDMLRSLGARRGQTFWMIKLPSALPFIFAGLGSGIVLSLLGAVVGEFVGARAGLGNLILTQNSRLETASVFATLVVLAVIGITLNAILSAVQARVVFWARPKNPSSGNRSWQRKTSRRRTALSTSAMLVACSILLELPSRSSHAETPVSLKMTLGHQYLSPAEEAYAYAVPLQLGYFKQEGLDVTLEPTSGSTVAIQLVASGKADIGMSGPSTTFDAIGKGAKIISVFNLTPRYGTGLAVPEDSQIRKPADLRGQTLGVASLSSGRVPEAETMLANAGLQVGQNVEMVAVGTGAQAAAALQSHQVAGLYLWDNAYFVMQAQGIHLRIIRDVFPQANGLLDYVMFVRTDLVEKQPQVVEKLGRAIAKGMQYMVANPDTALDLFYKTFPDVKAKNAQERAIDLYTIRQVAKAIDVNSTASRQWGYFPDPSVSESLTFYRSKGAISANVPLNQLYTNRFTAAFNNFDRASLLHP